MSHYHNHSNLRTAEDTILSLKNVLSHIKKCKSEACYSLNTEYTMGPVWGSCFWSTKMVLCGSLAKAQIQLCSDPTAGFAFYQQRYPVWSLLLARPLHSDECDYSVIGDLSTTHPSLEPSGIFPLLTHIMEQTKFVFAWKDINTVQRFLCRPDKQEQDKRLERCAAFFRELILLSFKNVSLSFTYRTFQNDIFVGHVNRWKTMSCWDGSGKK